MGLRERLIKVVTGAGSRFGPAPSRKARPCFIVNDVQDGGKREC